MNDEVTYKQYPHNPPHLFVPESKYFITASTYREKPFLKSEQAKHQLLESIRKACNGHNWILEDWVILDNHYHLMLQAPEGNSDLSKMMAEIHRFTALWIKKNVRQAQAAKRIFWNFWDSCITFEKSYFARLNYIYFNPIKHGYVQDPADYKYGSYLFRIKSEEKELERLRQNYPWDKVIVKDDF